MTAKALDTIPAVGPYFSGFFEGMFRFLMPVGLTLAGHLLLEEILRKHDVTQSTMKEPPKFRRFFI